MTDEPNEIIRTRRLQLGLSDRFVSENAGLSIPDYVDIEQHVDELRKTLPLRNLRKLCAVLDLNILELIEGKLDQSTPVITHKPCQTSRSELVRGRRAALGLSLHQLAERIGFEEYVVAELENDSDYLESWSIELIKNLAANIELPVRKLI